MEDLNQIVKLDYNKSNLQLQIANLENELANNPTYIKLKEVQSKLSDYEKQIKAVAEEIIRASGEKTVENENVRLTLVQSYKLAIIGNVPEEYMSLQPDETKIKNALTLFNKNLDFAEMAPSKPYVKITMKKSKGDK